MSPPTSRALIDSVDMLVLGTISIATIVWFARRQIADIIFTKGSSDQSKTSAPIKRATSPLAGERNFVKIMEKQGRQVIIFYGSQTGTAEDYATRLAKECTQKYGVSCMTADLEMYDLSYLDKVSSEMLVIFVLATYGEGEPTDNATEFWELLAEDPTFSEASGEEPLTNLRYIMFGLGNKTYEHYNAVGRTVDHNLSKLGAQRIGERGEGDDDGSLEDDFLAWQEGMWPQFCEALGVDESNAQKGPRQPIYTVDEIDQADNYVYDGEMAPPPKDTSRVTFDAKRPYYAPITTRELFRGGDRSCLHVEVDITNTNLSYQTGDHAAVWPVNNDREVERLASMLGLSDKLDKVIMVTAIDSAAPKKHPFPVPTTYHTALRHYLDICALASRQAIASLVEFAPTDDIKEHLKQLATDKDQYYNDVASPMRNLGEVLELVVGNDSGVDFSHIPFDWVAENIPRLQPRYYSISSSAKESPQKLSATAVVLETQPKSTPGRTFYGVNTNYLYHIHSKVHRLESDRHPSYRLDGPHGSLWDDTTNLPKVPVHIRRSQFKLPRNPKTPVVLVGPGTGVAPFRAFVRERAMEKKEGKPMGKTLLFFGCRHSQQDFLYDDEWSALFADLGNESRMITAFSRETAEKVYVQHRLREQSSEVWEMIQAGAYIYVCGDAKNMARDVNHTLVAIASELGGMDKDAALEFVKSLRSTGRYQEDVWS